jgi:hypothetical protein
VDDALHQHEENRVRLPPRKPTRDRRVRSRLKPRRRHCTTATRVGLEGAALGPLACCFAPWPLLRTRELALGPVFYHPSAQKNGIQP